MQVKRLKTMRHEPRDMKTSLFMISAYMILGVVS